MAGKIVGQNREVYESFHVLWSRIESECQEAVRNGNSNSGEKKPEL